MSSSVVTVDPVTDVLARNAAGEHIGVTSVCSAHPLVLLAAVVHARETGELLLVEATSNQVDQTGGYTGLRPADFHDLVLHLADQHGLPRERVVLGGDHLGPNRWKGLPPAEAMGHADVLVAAYVAAGFTKIHLDCSFPCAGDPVPLTDDLVAARAARLVCVAEDTAATHGRTGTLRYVIGTEVPTPGGAHETLHDLVPTTTEAASATLQTHREAFAARELSHVWPRVAAVVVQPAVEFDHTRVIDFDPSATTGLSRVLDAEPTMVFEAHSTDYQTTAALSALVAQHWAVLKVGPGLTFALREALFALAAIEDELVPAADRSHLLQVLEDRMLAEPAQWDGYYPGTMDEQRVLRRFSYSDRARYYWPDPTVDAAVRTLLGNLDARTVPLPLLSQHLPAQYVRIRAGELSTTAEDLVVDHVRDVLRSYSRACHPPTTRPTTTLEEATR